MRPVRWSKCSLRRKVGSPRSETPKGELQTLKALIVAASLGSRLRGIAASKPLAPINGKPLIQNVIETALQAGIHAFVVVTGYAADPLEAFLQTLARNMGISIETTRNPEWTKSNGLSVIAAEPLLDEKFILLMSDHLFEADLLGDLLRAPWVAGGATLAIDRRLENPLVDLDDVTRVETGPKGQIVRIGKGLAIYDAFDTGVFLASRGLISAIREDLTLGGQGSISAGMMRLAESGLAQTLDIGARFWLDVDDAVAWGHAERLRA